MTWMLNINNAAADLRDELRHIGYDANTPTLKHEFRACIYIETHDAHGTIILNSWNHGATIKLTIHGAPDGENSVIEHLPVLPYKRNDYGPWIQNTAAYIQGIVDGCTM